MENTEKHILPPACFVGTLTSEFDEDIEIVPGQRILTQCPTRKKYVPPHLRSKLITSHHACYQTLRHPQNPPTSPGEVLMASQVPRHTKVHLFLSHLCLVQSTQNTNKWLTPSTANTTTTMVSHCHRFCNRVTTFPRQNNHHGQFSESTWDHLTLFPDLRSAFQSCRT